MSYIPELEVQIGQEVIPAYFDTGSNGRVSLPNEKAAALFAEGALQQSVFSVLGEGKEEERKKVMIEQLKIADFQLTKLYNYDLKRDGLEVTLGYQFLKRFISVWNFSKKTITLIDSRAYLF